MHQILECLNLYFAGYTRTLHWTLLNKTLFNRCRNQNATLISKYERQLEIVREINDNQELVELCVYYLGINTIEVKKPGYMSNSRWISKLLYSLKVYYRNLYLSLNDIIFLIIKFIIILM